MAEIDYTATASLTWQNPPYGKSAPEEHCEDFNLAEAVRFVMETLLPEYRLHAKIDADGRHFDPDAIRALYEGPNFPAG